VKTEVCPIKKPTKSFNFGNGPSTGLDQTALGKIQTGLAKSDIVISESEMKVLRELALQVAEIAASSKMARTRELWTKLNNLERVRPVILCDPENGWNEIITEAQMKCQGKLARRWEMNFRKEIFWGEYMGDDKPVEPYFDVPYTASPDGWGLKTVFHKTETAGSFSWENPIKDYATDLGKLHSPKIEIDWETTNGCMKLAHELFDSILHVRLKGIWWWSLGLTLPAAMLRGLTNLFYDFIENPVAVKELLAIISKGQMDKLDYLEKHNLLSLNNDGTYVGSGGYGFSEQLPHADFDGIVRCRDMWGFAESQETVQVSPQMYEEFVFPYEKPILDRFGLNCYGCCEPLEKRWNAVRNHANLRRVSCSPWANLEQMARNLGNNYICSIKVNPVAIASPEIDREAIRAELRRALELTKGCVVEVIMKDNHTIGNQPGNVVEWCRITKEEAQRVSN